MIQITLKDKFEDFVSKNDIYAHGLNEFARAKRHYENEKERIDLLRTRQAVAHAQLLVAAYRLGYSRQDVEKAVLNHYYPEKENGQPNTG